MLQLNVSGGEPSTHGARVQCYHGGLAVSLATPYHECRCTTGMAWQPCHARLKAEGPYEHACGRGTSQSGGAVMDQDASGILPNRLAYLGVAALVQGLDARKHLHGQRGVKLSGLHGTMHGVLNKPEVVAAGLANVALEANGSACELPCIGRSPSRHRLKRSRLMSSGRAFAQSAGAGGGWACRGEVCGLRKPLHMSMPLPLLTGPGGASK